MANTNYPNEELNESIIRNMVQDHIDGFEDWELIESPEQLTVKWLDEDDIVQETSGQSFGDLVDQFKDSIEEDLMNHNDYLNKEQLNYLGERGMDVQEALDRDYKMTIEQMIKQSVSSMDKEKVVNDMSEQIINKVLADEANRDQNNQKENGTKRIDYVDLSQKIEHQIPLTDIVREAGYSLKKNGTTSYTTEEHNSLVIDLKANRFYWNSRPPRKKDVEKAQERIKKTGKGTVPQCLSGGVLTFYMIEHNKSFKEAVQELGKRIDPSLNIDLPKKERVDGSKKMSPMERHKFLTEQLQKNQYQNKDMKNVKAYLIKTRKIDPEIVDLFIKRNMLFQTQDEKGRTQAAFIGKDENGMLSYVSFRSTSSTSKFKGDYSGCNYDRGCFFEPQRDIPFGWKDDPNKKPLNTNKRLLVFESNIEMMSYMSLLKLNNIDYNHFAYLSCGSISKSNCVLETCKTYGYDKVVVMFNNDREKENNPGLTKANYVTKQLRQEGIEAHPLVPSKCNDWNDTLIAFKEKQIELEKYKSKAPEKKEPVKTRGQPSIGIDR